MWLVNVMNSLWRGIFTKILLVDKNIAKITVCSKKMLLNNLHV